MAFGGDNFGSFTNSCLDDIPFKIGPKFKPPTKILLPPQVDLSNPSTSRALNAEYSFEVELAVLKWSEERERQQEEQRLYQEQLERDLQLQQQQIQQQQLEDEAEKENTDEQPEPMVEPSSVASTEPLYDNTYVNLPSTTYPTPAPRSSKQKPTVPARPVYANMSLPNPLLANISDNILTPTPIVQSELSTQEKEPPTNMVNNFDVRLFEKEDDPFDNLELQTIDDLEELKNVLEETSKNSPSPRLPSGDEAGETQSDINLVSHSVDLLNDSGNRNTTEADENSLIPDPIYENIVNAVPKTTEQSSVRSSIDISNLPPVPPRRDLVGRSMPLPPIGTHTSDMGLGAFNPITQNCVSQSLDIDTTPQVPATNHVNNIFLDCNNMPFPSYSAPAVKTGAAVSKPPRTFKYTRHNMDDSDDDETPELKSVTIQKGTDQKSGVNFSVGFDNKRSSPEFVSRRAAQRKAPPVPRRTPSPPSRPSSNQIPTTVNQSGSRESLPLWNRYSPLPPAPAVPSTATPATTGSSSQAMPGTDSTSHVISTTVNSSTEENRCSPTDPYSHLSTGARNTVNNLVGMGFSRPRVSRAVERLGQDEKEVVEYLCLVDQLLEKGYNVESAEMALLMFHNSPKKACAYLDLFTQFIELGFNQDKIKEALVDTNNDREKSLDILTAT